MTLSEDLTLYAIWKPNTYTITYVFSHNLDAGYKDEFDTYTPSGKVTTGSKVWASYDEYFHDSEYFTDTEYPNTYVYGIGVPSLPNNVKKDSFNVFDTLPYGHTYEFAFDGWYTDSSLSYEYIINKIPTDYYGDITLYASFTNGAIGI